MTTWIIIGMGSVGARDAVDVDEKRVKAKEERLRKTFPQNRGTKTKGLSSLEMQITSRIFNRIKRKR